MRSHRGVYFDGRKIFTRIQKYKSLDTMAAAYQKNQHNKITITIIVVIPTILELIIVIYRIQQICHLILLVLQTRYIILYKILCDNSNCNNNNNHHNDHSPKLLFYRMEEFEILDEDDEDGESTAAKLFIMILI